MNRGTNFKADLANLCLYENDYLTYLPLVAYICVGELGRIWFGAKRLSEPNLAYC